MKKLENTQIGVRWFRSYTRITTDQAESLINNIKNNQANILQIKGMEMPYEFNDDQDKRWVCYQGEQIRIFLDIALSYYRPSTIVTEISSVSSMGFVLQSENDISKIADEYNKMVGKLSKLIPDFSKGMVSDIEYKIAFDLNELGYDKVTDELCDLVQRIFPDSPYSDRMYWSLSGINESVSVIYFRDCCKNKPVPTKETQKYSTNVISFSVNTSKSDVIDLVFSDKFKPEINKNAYLLTMKGLFSEKKIKDFIRKYFESTIMRGNYFKLALAVEAVQNCDLSQEKKNDMVSALKYISDSGDIDKARLYIVRKHLGGLDYDGALKNLVSIGVNPITIDEKCDIEFIPGLLETCESLVYDANLPALKG